MVSAEKDSFQSSAFVCMMNFLSTSPVMEDLVWGSLDVPVEGWNHCSPSCKVRGEGKKGDMCKKDKNMAGRREIYAKKSELDRDEGVWWEANGYHF